MKDDDDDIQDYVTKCPDCEYHKNRAAMWRAEAYAQAGHDIIERPWTGLTDEEYINLLIQASKPMKTAPDMAVVFGHLVEAKLKEKNT